MRHSWVVAIIMRCRRYHGLSAISTLSLNGAGSTCGERRAHDPSMFLQATAR
jgi:hypothetical protein